MWTVYSELEVEERNYQPNGLSHISVSDIDNKTPYFQKCINYVQEEKLFEQKRAAGKKQNFCYFDLKIGRTYRVIWARNFEEIETRYPNVKLTLWSEHVENGGFSDIDEPDDFLNIIVSDQDPIPEIKTSTGLIAKFKMWLKINR
jgi:hypothetical protein